MKILLIEDEDFIRDLYKRQLELAGMPTDAFGMGNDGLNSAHQNPTAYDLVLLDIMLPDTNGLQILKDLKQNTATKQIPVILLTNLSQDMLIKEGFELGAEGYLVKAAYTPAQIVQEVKNIIAKKPSPEITQAPQVVPQTPGAAPLAPQAAPTATDPAASVAMPAAPVSAPSAPVMSTTPPAADLTAAPPATTSQMPAQPAAPIAPPVAAPVNMPAGTPPPLSDPLAATPTPTLPETPTANPTAPADATTANAPVTTELPKL